MITFTFDNGLVTTLRTSGTEPKIKYYCELCASLEEQDVNKLKYILNEMVSAIVAEFLQPEFNALIPRGTQIKVKIIIKNELYDNNKKSKMKTTYWIHKVKVNYCLSLLFYKHEVLTKVKILFLKILLSSFKVQVILQFIDNIFNLK